MKNQFLLAATLTIAVLTPSTTSATGRPPKMPGNFVRVKGGTFKDTKSNYYNKGVTLSDFYIDKYLVTQKEWV